MSKQVALALSGGGMRGAAHIGVIKRLNELNIKTEVISGTSVGALVGVFLADGYSALEVEKIFLESKFSFDFNFMNFSSALFSNKKLEDLLRKNLRAKHFSELKTKFFACATNYESGEPEYFEEGELIPVLLASSAIPIAYEKVSIQNKDYVDGGLSRNLPTEPLLSSPYPIIGVHVNPMDINTNKKTFSQKLDHIVHLSLKEKLNKAQKDCRVFIEPKALLNYTIFETAHLKEMIAIGYEEAKRLLNEETIQALF